MKLCNLDGMSCYGHGWIAWKQTLCDCKVLHDMTTYIKKKCVPRALCALVSRISIAILTLFRTNKGVHNDLHV